MKAKTAESLAKDLFKKELKNMHEAEKRVLEKLIQRTSISRDISRDYTDRRMFGERVADRVASFGGSWTFLFIFGGTLLFWVILNSFILVRRGDAFDPYPYILLNLFLSMLAAVQAPIIMMSQNRQAARDRLTRLTITKSISKPNWKFPACTTNSTSCAKPNGSN